MECGNIILCHVLDQLTNREVLMSQLIQWVEVWTDSATRGEFFLALRAMEDGSFIIVNPHQQNQVVRSFRSYEDAIHWFNEDEYERVEGRWLVNTPFDQE